MAWPRQSPVLNIIESVWDHTKRQKAQDSLNTQNCKKVFKVAERTLKKYVQVYLGELVL